MKTILIQLLFVTILICTLPTTKATNTPPSCTATLTASSTNVLVGQQINLTVSSNNIPGILVNYDIKLYADDNLVAQANNVPCFLVTGIYGNFTYTFVNIAVTKWGVTTYTAVIYKYFLDIILVQVESGDADVTARRNQTLQRQKVTAAGLSYTLYSDYIISPPLGSGDPAPTGSLHCHVLNLNSTFEDDFDSGDLVLKSDGSGNYEQSCEVGTILSGQIIQVTVTYAGDANYGPASYTTLIYYSAGGGSFAAINNSPPEADIASDKSDSSSQGNLVAQKKRRRRSLNYLE